MKLQPVRRWLALVALAFLGLQLFFVLRIGAMARVDPQSTAFQRTEAWRITQQRDKLIWRQEWRNYDQLGDAIKRAVIASEDDAFAYHDGVDWESIEKAWQKNLKTQGAAQTMGIGAANGKSGNSAKTAKTNKANKIVGGSTITQQLAKNLLLSGERNVLRKGQEFVLATLLELLLGKERILEIYLNNVEWGEGIFGAEAAAQHYFKKPAAKLSNYEAARLAVMLPRPRYFEKLQQSGYLQAQSAVIQARMANAELP